MRLAQITFHNAQNCGAVLQAWALQVVLKRLGHEVFLPNCNSVGAYCGHFRNFNLDRSSFFNGVKYCIWYLLVELLSFGSDELKDGRFRMFLRRNLSIVNCRADELPKFCDAVIFGSDQIWNPKWTGDETGYFLGERLPAAIPKIAYGASVGDLPLCDEHVNRVVAAARRFNAISLRESVMQKLLYDKEGRQPDIVCDPTLLLSAEEYLAIAEPRRLFERSYLLFFSLRGNQLFEQVAYELARRLGLACVVVNMSQRGLWRCRMNTKIAVSPDRLLAYLRDADYVLTDSFHGVALSIVLRKRFLALKVDETTPDGRISNLLKRVSLSDRLIACWNVLSNIGTLTAPFPAESGNAIINMRTDSEKWISDALLAIRV